MPAPRHRALHRWSVVSLLCVGVIIGYIDRTNLAIALASPAFSGFFSLSDSGRGVLNSAFYWAYTVMQIPAGFIVDRFGPRVPLAVGVLFWCAMSGSTAAAGSLGQLATLRVLLGVGESALVPAGLRWIRDHVEEQRRGLAVGIFMSGTKWGPAVSAPLSAWLLARYGWRAMFLLLGLGGAVWLAPWIWITRHDREVMESRRVSEELVRTPEPPFLSLFRERALWGTLIGTFCYNYFVFFSLTWLPAYFVERRRLSLNSMGIYTMFSFAGTGLMAVLAGYAADKLIERGFDAVNTRRWFTIAGLLAASTEIAGALSQSANVAVFFAIFSMTGLGLATANYWAVTQTVLPQVGAGRIAGLQNTSLNLAGIVAPIVTGWLKQVSGGYAVPMQAIWVILIAGVGSYLFLMPGLVKASRYSDSDLDPASVTGPSGSR